MKPSDNPRITAGLKSIVSAMVCAVVFISLAPPAWSDGLYLNEFGFGGCVKNWDKSNAAG